jgi:flagellar basal-body rod modification protein FlgD
MSFISPVSTDANGQPRATGSLQSLGKDDFLQLLVTKLQYQDPLEPMKDEDFIAQLAQFSTLEQMNNIADGITASNEWGFLQMQSINNAMAAGLIGKEIKAGFDEVYVDGDHTPTISFTTEEFASEIEFVIRDSSGEIVKTLRETEVEAGTGSITWDGKDDMGNEATEGWYRVEATAVNGEGVSFEPSLSLVGLVSAILYRDGAAYLSVNGADISLGDIIAVGEPGAFTDDE